MYLLAKHFHLDLFCGLTFRINKFNLPLNTVFNLEVLNEPNFSHFDGEFQKLWKYVKKKI